MVPILYPVTGPKTHPTPGTGLLCMVSVYNCQYKITLFITEGTGLHVVATTTDGHNPCS